MLISRTVVADASARALMEAIDGVVTGMRMVDVTSFDQIAEKLSMEIARERRIMPAQQ